MPEKILIAENHSHTLEMLRRIIEKEGYQTILANDGEKALQYIHRYRPDLILTERLLPKITGLQICRKLNTHTIGQIPVIFLSVLDSELDIMEGLRAGADDYLTKPFSPDELNARIERVLARYRLSGTNPKIARYLTGIRKNTIQSVYLTMHLASLEATWKKEEWRGIFSRIRSLETELLYTKALSLISRCRKALKRRETHLDLLHGELISLRTAVLLSHKVECELFPCQSGESGKTQEVTTPERDTTTDDGHSKRVSTMHQQMLSLYKEIRSVLESVDRKKRRLGVIRTLLEQKQHQVRELYKNSIDARTP